MFSFRQLIIIGLVACLLAPPQFAQQPAQAKPPDPPQNQKPQEPAQNQDVVRISTQLVQVDVVVTDKKSRHVEDLTQADFQIEVDGKQQSLTHFAHLSLPVTVKRELAARKKTDPAPPPVAMPTRQIAPEEVRRTMAFIVDDLGLSFQSTEFVRETLRKFVAEQMQEGDLVAIIRTGNGLGMLEQFTSEKRLLYAAIERLIWNPLTRDMMPTFDDTTTEVSDEAAERQTIVDTFEEFRTTNFSVGTLGAISFVVQGLRYLPGRKSVILLSDGFRINSESNDDANTNLMIEAMKNLVEQANRSSVVVYSMDAKGLQPYNPGGSVGGRPSADSLTNALDTAQAALEGPTFLAKQTGGFVVTNTNDLNIGIQEALYDQQSYYLLGFDPDDETFNQRFHSIKVKVNRPGLTVRTRSGFFGASESALPAAPKTRGEQLMTALLSPLGTRDLSVRMTPYFFNSTKEGPLVRTLFHIDCSKLTFSDGANGQKQLNLDLAAFAFDENGATADVTVHRVNLSFDEQRYRQVLANGLAYRRDFRLKRPGAYQFRAILRDDATGLTGSASQFIQTPDLSKQRLTMSGLVLTAPKQAAAPTGADAQPQAASDATQTSALPTSPYVRKFPGTGWVQYGAAIYNATTDKKTGQPQLTVQAEIYRDGKPIHQAPARALNLSSGVNAKHFDYVDRLRLTNLAAGDYLLRLIVTDKLAKKKYGRVEQWMDFRVE